MTNAVLENKPEKNGVALSVDCLMMNKSINAPDIYAHYHGYIELLYLIDGEMLVWLNDKQYKFIKGELIVINSNETHRLVSLTEVSKYAVVKFMPSVIYDTQQSLLELKYILPFIVNNSNHQKVFDAGYVATTDIPKLMLHAIDETIQEKIGWELALRADVLNIFLSILRYWEKEGISLDIPKADNELIRAIQNTIDYVTENYATITEKEVAEKCGLSYSYFSRSFKRIMRMSFTEYVNYLKISQAQRMLLTTSMSISEIAEQLGFSSSSHFIQTFKKFKNCSPKKFRMYCLTEDSEN